MATISPQLRNFKEPTKDELTQLFFALPSSSSSFNVKRPDDATSSGPAGNLKGGEKSTGPHENELEKMEINAVLSLGVQGEEDSYVSARACIFPPQSSCTPFVVARYSSVWISCDPA